MMPQRNFLRVFVNSVLRGNDFVIFVLAAILLMSACTDTQVLAQKSTEKSERVDLIGPVAVMNIDGEVFSVLYKVEDSVLGGAQEDSQRKKLLIKDPLVNEFLWEVTFDRDTFEIVDITVTWGVFIGSTISYRGSLLELVRKQKLFREGRNIVRQLAVPKSYEVNIEVNIKDPIVDEKPDWRSYEMARYAQRIDGRIERRIPWTIEAIEDSATSKQLVSSAVEKVLSNSQGWRRAGVKFIPLDGEITVLTIRFMVTRDTDLGGYITLGGMGSGIECGIVLNSKLFDESFASFYGEENLAREIQRIINHEVGHCFGFIHSWSSKDVMCDCFMSSEPLPSDLEVQALVQRISVK